MTLEGAIQEQINLGVKNPEQIAQKVKDLYGPEWLIAQLVTHDEEIVADIARHALTSGRRAIELAHRAESRPAKANETRWQKAGADLLLAPVWVPGKGWGPLGQLTPEDCEAVSNAYYSRAIGNAMRGQWYRELAEAQRKQKVERVADLKKIPELPTASDVRELPELVEEVA